MYSQQAGSRPGTAPPKIANRYMKGRLPEGVDFAAYPGRSSTPLPTAESKSAERINQLKIWNEAATNDDKRRLNAAKGIGSGVATATAARRTDSFKDAKDRHSASFHTQSTSSPSHPNPDHIVADATAHPPSYNRSAVGTVGNGQILKENDIYADRSDSESDEDLDDSPPHPNYNPAERFAPSATVNSDYAPANHPVRHHNAASANTHTPAVQSAKYTPAPLPSHAPPQTRPAHTNHDKTMGLGPGTHAQPKESKACCTIM